MDTDAKPIKCHCNWSSWELMLTKLSQLIGILCSSGHKSVSSYLDKVVRFRHIVYSDSLTAATVNEHGTYN